MLFLEWLAHRNIETLLRLLEGADYFNPQQYNSAFVAGLDDLLGRIHDPAAREQIEAMKKFRLRRLHQPDHWPEPGSRGKPSRAFP